MSTVADGLAPNNRLERTVKDGGRDTNALRALASYWTRVRPAAQPHR
jgi:hypothetical protein